MGTPGVNNGTATTESSSEAPAESLWQSARVGRIEQRTPRIKSFFFQLARPFDFRAGQHVDVRLTADDGYQARRSYSIASGPGSAGGLELAIELLEYGEVSPFFHQVVQVGDEIDVRGPLGGHFVWETAEDGPLLLVGGGSGVVPLMSMLRHRTEQESKAIVTLLLSTRTWDDVLFRDELIAMHEARDGFELVLTLTREQPKRPGDYARRLDADMIHEILGRLPPLLRAYVCGPNPFVETSADALVACGTSPSRVRTERYGG
jgi:ferredoxin-NADP reductase